MSSSPTNGSHVADDGSDPRLGRSPVPVGAHWGGWREVRADLRSAVRLVLVLALAGVVAGLLWWWLAPRADFRITGAGPVAIGDPPGELLIADDAVLTLILAGFGLLAGAAAWFLRRRRGVATVLALALGGSLMAAVAWQLGELLGAGPTRTELSDVGRIVTTSLTLGSLPALALAPFGALLAYLVPVITAHRDDLDRAPGATAPDGSAAEAEADADADAGEPDADRPLVGVPPWGPVPDR